MKPMCDLLKTAFFLGIAAILPAIALAQNEPKVRLNVGGATTAGSVDGESAVSFSAGYRFAKQFSFDVEVTAIDGSPNQFNPGSIDFRDFGVGSFRDPRIPDFNIGNISVENEGETLLSTVGFRYHIPTADSRFRPYVTGGMGIARTETEYDIRVLTGGANVSLTEFTRGLIPRSVSSPDLEHTGLAGSAGVGASIRVWRELSVGVDARYFRLDRGRDLGTFGGSVAYRF